MGNISFTDQIVIKVCCFVLKNVWPAISIAKDSKDYVCDVTMKPMKPFNTINYKVKYVLKYNLSNIYHKMACNNGWCVAINNK